MDALEFALTFLMSEFSASSNPWSLLVRLSRLVMSDVEYRRRAADIVAAILWAAVGLGFAVCLSVCLSVVVTRMCCGTPSNVSKKKITDEGKTGRSSREQRQAVSYACVVLCTKIDMGDR